MSPSPVRRIVLRTGKTCLKVLRSLATPARRHRAARVLPAGSPCVGTSPAAPPPPPPPAPEAKAARKAAPSPLDDVVDLEDLQNRLNEAAERKVAACA